MVLSKHSACNACGSQLSFLHPYPRGNRVGAEHSKPGTHYPHTWEMRVIRGGDHKGIKGWGKHRRQSQVHGVSCV